MAGDKVKIEVMKGAARNPVLAVNDTRVTGPKCGPYRVVETFTVDRDVLLAALSPPPAPPKEAPRCPTCGKPCRMPGDRGGADLCEGCAPKEAEGAAPCGACNGTGRGVTINVACPACGGTGRAGGTP